MIKNILITGGSGMIGTRLTTLLQAKGYHVSHLGRARKNGAVKTFIWNPSKHEIDTEALKEADAIINLAGAGIADR
ncbi:MAG TPA: NAD-dependent epimerase/dehydratase family protein, partial [Chryseosolibacter sp.]